METSHTPGPWSRNDGLTISDNHNVKIADVSYASHPQECEANAALIATAPDLLKALEIIQAMAAPVSTLPWEKTPTVDFAKTMDAIAEQARAAIAKAMGT